MSNLHLLTHSIPAKKGALRGFRLLTMVLVGLFAYIAPAARAADTLSEDRLPTEPTEGAEGLLALKEALLGRTARESITLVAPENLYEIKSAIQRSFGIHISSEPLPEECSATESKTSLQTFSIAKGEPLREAIRRLEQASASHWVFDVYDGIPILRSNLGEGGHPNQLDTIVTLNIEVDSVWEALCALAREVNQTQTEVGRENPPLMITMAGPDIYRWPAKGLIAKKTIRVAMEDVPTRKALCAIISHVEGRPHYFYVCHSHRKPEYSDYVQVNASDEDGRSLLKRMNRAEIEENLTTKDWMSSESLLRVQAPRWVKSGAAPAP